MMQAKISFLSVLFITAAAFTANAQAAGSQGLSKVIGFISSDEGASRLSDILSDRTEAGKLKSLAEKLGVSSAEAQKAIKDPRAAQKMLAKALKDGKTQGLETEVAALLGKPNLVSAEGPGFLKQSVRSESEVARAIQTGNTTGAKLSLGKSADKTDAAAIRSVVEKLKAEGKVLPKTAAEVLLLTDNPIVVENVFGKGINTECVAMGPTAIQNLFVSYQAGAAVVGKGDQAVATAIAGSLKDSVKISDQEAKKRSCKLASAPCNLYGKAVQRACAAGL